MSKKKFAHVIMAGATVANVVAPVITTASYADTNESGINIENISEENLINEAIDVDVNENYRNIYSNNGSYLNNTVSSAEYEILSKIKSGEYKTRWLTGIDAPKIDDFSWKIEGDYQYYSASHRYGSKWYDSNKKFNGVDDRLCSAATAANMLHWWLDRNQENVSKYLNMNDKNGIVTPAGGVDPIDLRKLMNDGYNVNTHQGSIFDLFKYYFPYKNVWTSSTLALFMSGHQARSGNNGRDINKELWEKINREEGRVLDKRGGFFKDVFKSDVISGYKFISGYYDFSSYVKHCLDNDIAMGLVYRTTVKSAHVINLWGADFDSNGNVTGIYVTDSDDDSTRYMDKHSHQNELVGMKRYRVSNINGLAKINNIYNGEERGAEIQEIHTLSLGNEYWNKYFAENKDLYNKQKQESNEKKAYTIKNEISIKKEETPKREEFKRNNLADNEKINSNPNLKYRSDGKLIEKSLEEIRRERGDLNTPENYTVSETTNSKNIVVENKAVNLVAKTDTVKIVKADKTKKENKPKAEVKKEIQKESRNRNFFTNLLEGIYGIFYLFR